MISVCARTVTLCRGGAGVRRYGERRLLDAFERPVPSLASVRVETPIDVAVAPLEQGADRLVVSVFGPAAGSESGSTLKVKASGDRVEVVGRDPDALCVVRAPLDSSLAVSARGDANLDVRRMRGADTDLTSEAGTITVENIAGRSIKLTSDSGAINCEGTIHAEQLKVRTGGAGNISCSHLRTGEFETCTDSGRVRVESCYTRRAHFTTVLGSLDLCFIHGACKVEILERGDLTLCGLDGSIAATLKRGNVLLHATRLQGTNNIFVHEAGSIEANLAIIDDLRLIELIAKKLNVDKNIINLGKIIDDDALHSRFRYENESEKLTNELYVECRNGTVELKMCSWEQMLKNKGIEFDK